MIQFEVSHSDWLTSKRYWNELQKHFVQADDKEKADFINHIIFESNNELNNSSSNLSSPKQKDNINHVTRIPSINTISAIMSEIDRELTVTTTTDHESKKEETRNKTKPDADKEQEKERKTSINPKVKEFIIEPVKFSIFFCGIKKKTPHKLNQTRIGTHFSFVFCFFFGTYTLVVVM